MNEAVSKAWDSLFFVLFSIKKPSGFGRLLEQCVVITNGCWNKKVWKTLQVFLPLV